MNTQFEQGMVELENQNFEEALKHFEEVDVNDEDYYAVLAFKFCCLMELSSYSEALSVLNKLIAKEPYDELLWISKAMCHIYLKDDKNAYSSLENVERIVDPKNKASLLQVAKLYNLLGERLKVIEYCDKALAVDENYREALLEKATVILQSDDENLIDEVSDKLIETSDNSLLSLMPVFLLKLLSKDYRGSFELLDNVADDEDDEAMELVKSLIYTRLSDDLNAKILLSQEISLSVDEAINLMLDFKEKGMDHGEIYGVHYFIL